ncbi:MAG: amidohydrolase family protein [Candidatus Woesearchaeota archaeon]
MSTFIENGKVFVNGKLIDSNLVISDGKIHELTLDRVTCENYIDASNKLVLPGVIDSFADSGTKFAAGGVTTALMQNNDALSEKNVNFGFHLKASLENFEDLKAVRNVPSFYVENVTGDFSRMFSCFRRVSVNASDAAAAIAIVKGLKTRLCVFKTTLAEEKLFKKTLKPKVSSALSVESLADDERLWKLVQDGVIDIGYGTNALAFMLGSIHKGRVSIARCVELFMENPARVFGLLNKGFIKPGFDADIVIVDGNLENGGLCPVATLVNGKMVFGIGDLHTNVGKEVSCW